jgi:hypothetical protein
LAVLSVLFSVGPADGYILLQSPESAIVFFYDNRSQNLCPGQLLQARRHGSTKLEGFCPAATGFLIGFTLRDNPARVLSLLVTARHVVTHTPQPVPGQSPAPYSLFVRPNKDEFLYPLESQFWIYPPDPRRDVAVYLHDRPFPSTHVETMPIAMLATYDVLQREGIAPGDSIFSMGLVPAFANYKRNYPVARQGTLALFDPDPEGPGEGIWYFAEAQSYGGNSGGPVFLSTGGVRGTSFGPGGLWLLGVTSGFIPQATQLGVENIGLSRFTRADVLRELLCSEAVTRVLPPTVDPQSECRPRPTFTPTPLPSPTPTPSP